MRSAFLLVCFLAATVQAAPRIIVPADLSVPNPRAVQVDGLSAGATITITTRRRDTEGKTSYVGRATYTADTDGRVDTQTAVARGGTYTGADPLGLFWSAQARPARSDDPPSGTVRVTADVGGKQVASASTRVEPDPASLVVSKDTPFPGAIWVRPRQPGRHPVIIVLGGSEGGDLTARVIAPMFAAQGYATLGLPYYDPTGRIAGLQRSFTEIPVDRLATVRAWLAKQPDVDIKRLGIWGFSKGSEFALIAASRYDWIRAVVAVVPTDLVWEGWGKSGPKTSSFSFAGKPLPFEPYAGLDAAFAQAQKTGKLYLRPVHVNGRAANPGRVAAARIPIERFKGALLVIGGGKDAVWPSAEMATNIASTRQKAGKATELLVYPDAGHGLEGPGTTPTTPALTGLGGEASAIAHGRAQAWKATFQLFDRALK